MIQFSISVSSIVISNVLSNGATPPAAVKVDISLTSVALTVTSSTSRVYVVSPAFGVFGVSVIEICPNEVSRTVTGKSVGSSPTVYVVSYGPGVDGSTINVNAEAGSTATILSLAFTT